MFDDYSMITRTPVLVLLLHLLIILNVSLVQANVIATNIHNQTLWEAPDKQAVFSPHLTEEGVWAHLLYLKNDGCDSVEAPPSNSTESWFAMVKRGGCEFEQKVYNTQEAGYVGTIVHNVGSDELERMGPGTHGYKITIPSVFIGASDAEKFKRYERKLRYTLWINLQTTFNYWPLMKDFIIIACGAFAFGLLIGVFILVVRWVRDVRRRNRSRLSLAHLKKIPVKKFKKGDDYDVCAICLDEYEVGEKLRILPCSHAYHQKCIDPWLTKNKKFCPICKRKVLPGDDDTDSEEDSDSEAGQSETAPLLGATADNGGRQRGGGTFDNSGLPSNMRNEVHPLAYDESSSDDDLDYSLSTSNYQSSVEVHRPITQPTTRLTIANETSDDTEEEETIDVITGTVRGADNVAFTDDHFSNRDTIGCINDDGSRSSLDEYKPLMEEVVTVRLPPEASPIDNSDPIRDQIV